MDIIKTEAELLLKIFPFMKFGFYNNGFHIQIWINEQIPHGMNYNFWYDITDNDWYVENIMDTPNFNKFLDKFIEGLIKKRLY